VAIAARESNGASDQTDALYREHGAAVAALCRSLLRDRGEAEDATQQVFLSAHRALLNGTTPQEPLAWLLAVARNECYLRFRRRAVTPVPAGESADGATADASVHVLRAGELATVWDEVGQMPRAQREAFLLREIRGLSYGQLAAELSLSASSVRSLLLRARSRLRHRLGDVAAGLGGAQWVQALLRVAGGRDGPTPVPAAAKAAAVGLGALALAGAGDTPRAAHHASASPAHKAVHHRAETHARHVAAQPPFTPVAQHEVRSSEHSPLRHDASSGSQSRDRSDDSAVPAPGAAVASRDDGRTSITSRGSDGSGSGSGDTSTTTTSTTPTATTESGSDGDSASVTSMTTSSSDSGHDGSGSSGSDGSVSSGSSDGSSGHGGTD
jgi:RNA polymerase sigma-70 factor (ECF subfamily)